MTNLHEDLRTAAPLELVREPSGLRHYLHGRPVHAGTGLELRLAGAWVRVRYEWSFREGEPVLLYLPLGGAWELTPPWERDELFFSPEARLEVRDLARPVFRWPAEKRDEDFREHEVRCDGCGLRFTSARPVADLDREPCNACGRRAWVYR